MNEKNKYAFVNIPDADMDEVERLVSLLQELDLNLPYRIVFVGGAEWKTITKEEVKEVIRDLL